MLETFKSDRTLNLIFALTILKHVCWLMWGQYSQIMWRHELSLDIWGRRTKTTTVMLLVGFRPDWASNLHVIDIYLGNESYILNITEDFAFLNTFNWLIGVIHYYKIV